MGHYIRFQTITVEVNVGMTYNEVYELKNTIKVNFVNNINYFNSLKMVDFRNNSGFTIKSLVVYLIKLIIGFHVNVINMKANIVFKKSSVNRFKMVTA